MPSILTTELSPAETVKVLDIVEGHFVDLKAIEISPTKLTKSLSAFANAEGGELFIGIDEDKAEHARRWRGFNTHEDANSFIQIFEKYFPLGTDYQYSFLKSTDSQGYVLRVEIHKSRDVKFAADGKVYIRRGAQNLPIISDEELTRLRRNKGIVSFETEPVNTDTEIITNSSTVIRFMLDVIPTAEPEAWLKKQQVILSDNPTVAGLVLFADEPQTVLPKRCGLKIYRYQTSDDEGTRETLAFDPLSIEGCAYDQIHASVEKTAEIIESVRVNTPDGLESVSYPITALHEIITNAVLHRDYSIADDIHILIFDNRVEVMSPGTLPAHITPENILNERYARNGVIVRLINKFPNPPNKDVGEGLNTAFRAMREMMLKPPEVTQSGGYVKVILRHESLATPEELILEFLETHPQITNREAREICFIGSENKMKRIFQRMIARNLIELVPGTTRYNAAYKLVKHNRDEDRVAKSPQFDAELKELLQKIVVTNEQQLDGGVEEQQKTKMRPIQEPAFSDEASVQPSNEDSSIDSPCAFLVYKSPKNKVEQFAVIARFRELKEGVTSSLRNDFEAICKACGIHFERDKFSDDMKHGREGGLFSHTGNMVDGFPLSSFGQKYVDLLPDRDAIKALRKSKK